MKTAMENMLYERLCAHAKSVKVVEDEVYETLQLPRRQRGIRNMSKLEHLERITKQNHCKDLFLRIRRLRINQQELLFQLIEYYPIKSLAIEIANFDPGCTLYEHFLIKLEQAIDMFKGKVSVLVQRLKKDVVRMKSKWADIVQFSQVYYAQDAQDATGATERYCYLHYNDRQYELYPEPYPSSEDIFLAACC